MANGLIGLAVHTCREVKKKKKKSKDYSIQYYKEYNYFNIIIISSKFKSKFKIINT